MSGFVPPENEMLMMLIRTGHSTRARNAEPERWYQPMPPLAQEAPLKSSVAPTLEQFVRARYEAGHSQRAIARELSIDRRKVKRILDQAA
jgi:DNA invertase Pin-like site-specific DNA recombinase